MKESGVAGGCKCERIKNMEEIRTVFPKFDLGRMTQVREVHEIPRRVYATIDRNGEQMMRTIPSSTFIISGRRDFTANDL